MGMRYSLGNYINSSTLESVSTEDSIYPKENIYDKEQAMPWRMNAKSGNAVFNLGSNRPTILGIMNHNLVGTGAYSVTLSAHTSDAWGAPDWGPTAVTFHTQNMFLLISGVDKAWWRIVASDPDNGSNLEFGEIVLYTWAEFTMNFWWPYKEGLEYIVNESVTDYGHRKRTKKAKRKVFTLDFDGVKDDDLVGASNEVEAFFEELDGENPFIFIPDSDETNSWYVYCLNSMLAQRKFIDDNKFTLQLEEQARGITLL